MRNALTPKTCVLLLPALALVSCRTGPVPSPPVTAERGHEFARAEAKFLAGDFAEAEALYSDIVTRASLGPDKTRARYWRGVCRLKIGQTEQAQRDFERCLREPGGSELELKEGLADCARKLGRFHDAAHMYERLAKEVPPSRRKASFLYRLGLCQSQAGHAASGRKAFDAAAELDPDLRPVIQEQAAPRRAEFAVQLGVFGKRDNAEALARRLKKAGLPAEVLVREIGGRRLHAVWSNRFDSKAKAERHAQYLKRIGFDAIVVP